MHFDSDERVSDQLLKEMEKLTSTIEVCVGYINRKMFWMGKELRFVV